MPLRLIGIAAAAASLVLLAVLAGGVALMRSQGHGDDAEGSRPPAVAQTTSLHADAGPSLPIDDRFTGTISQRRRADGVAVSIHLSGTGRQAVQLDITLQVEEGDDGESQVSGNQAILSDASGAQLCQGGLSSLDDSTFSAQCAGTGAYAGRNLQLQGTITALTGTRLEGELRVTAS